VKNLALIVLSVLMGIGNSGRCQSTVFSAFDGSEKLANKSFEEGNYIEAITQYQKARKHNPGNSAILLRLAESYYLAKDYKNTISTYDIFLSIQGNVLGVKDLYQYAEAQSSLKEYKIAIELYSRYLKLQPDNEVVSKKIWRLNNLHYLYEDSAHYAIRSVPINTSFGELCAVSYRDGVVFTSNRKTSGSVTKVNANLNTPFYQLYSAKSKIDTATRMGYVLQEPMIFAKSIKSKYNIGPVAFYDHEQKMVYIASSLQEGKNGKRSLGIYFGELDKSGWRNVSGYQHNSDLYSIYDVTISEDGKLLIFSSNMNGGIGGRDLYSSQYSDGKWTTPMNLGEPINTTQSESFPYLHRDGYLYFSSDGHAGMGGLDIFKIQLQSVGNDEPQNLGYPLNSSYDDFGLSMDSLATHGYFTSNRKKGRYDDDIYEFDLDSKTYPFVVTGIVKYKEHTWSDQTETKIWSNVKISLFDSWKGKSVYDITTDENGKFSVSVPYFSKYYIQIFDQKGNEHKVSLEILKYRAEADVHEIVIIKDIFGENGAEK